MLFSILSFHVRIINPEGLLSKYLSLHVLKQSFGSWKIIIGFIKIYSSLIICSFEFFFFGIFPSVALLNQKFLFEVILLTQSNQLVKFQLSIFPTELATGFGIFLQLPSWNISILKNA